MNKTFEKVLDELKKLPAGEEFFEFLTTPDSTFDMMYPTLKEAVLEQFTDPSFRALKNSIIDDKSYIEVREKMPVLIEELKTVSGINKNKVQFLQIFLDLLISDPYDLEVEVELIHKNAKIPTYTNPTDAGADVYACEEITIPANSFGTIIPIGVKFGIPAGWEFQVRPRSGLSHKTAMRIANAPGTIDAHYVNEVGVIFDNHSNEDHIFQKGDRIAQLVLAKTYKAKFKEVDKLTIESDRGGGFGHSGS